MHHMDDTESQTMKFSQLTHAFFKEAQLDPQLNHHQTGRSTKRCTRGKQVFAKETGLAISGSKCLYGPFGRG